jgi:hypothetical protein
MIQIIHHTHRSRDSQHRIHRRALSPAALCLALLAASLPTGAARVMDDLFGVTVPLVEGEAAPGPGSAAFALDKVLVRVTGMRDVASDPRAAQLRARASQLVQQQGRASRLEARYVFDAVAIKREVMQAGLPYWESVRPVTLILLEDEVSAIVEADPDDANPAAGDEEVVGKRGQPRPSPRRSAPGVAVDPADSARATAPDGGDVLAAGAVIAASPLLNRRYVAAGEQSDVLDRLLLAAADRGVPVALPTMDALDDNLLLAGGLAPAPATSAEPPPGQVAAPEGADHGSGEEPVMPGGSPPHDSLSTATPAAGVTGAASFGVGDNDSDVSPDAGVPNDGAAADSAASDPVALLAARHQAGLVLRGIVSRAIEGVVLVEWELLNDPQGLRWVGDPADGVEFVSDLLAQRYASTLADTAQRVGVRVDDVSGALAYARTLAHFDQFELIDQVAVDRVRGSTVFLSLSSRAERAILERLIGLADFLQPLPAPTGSPAAGLAYRHGTPVLDFEPFEDASALPRANGAGE